MFYIIGYYVISISILVFWIIISFNNFRIVKDGLGAMLDRAFLIPSIVLYSPFFIYTLILTHLHFLNIINNREKQKLTQQSLESQLNYQQLKNQLSPHFLFNNINVLTSLIEENQKKAVDFSEKLSNIYRYFLEQEKQEVVSLNNELSFAKDYLELLQGRFERGLFFEIEVSKEAKEKLIVSTSLQQVLENVVKHNEISDEYQVRISICIKDNYLQICNNKNKKLSETAGHQKGIENIQKRYAYFSDQKIVITSEEKTYCIQLPLLNK